MTFDLSSVLAESQFLLKYFRVFSPHLHCELKNLSTESDKGKRFFLYILSFNLTMFIFRSKPPLAHYIISSSYVAKWIVLAIRCFVIRKRNIEQIWCLSKSVSTFKVSSQSKSFLLSHESSFNFLLVNLHHIWPSTLQVLTFDLQLSMKTFFDLWPSC